MDNAGSGSVKVVNSVTADSNLPHFCTLFKIIQNIYFWMVVLDQPVEKLLSTGEQDSLDCRRFHIGQENTAGSGM